MFSDVCIVTRILYTIDLSSCAYNTAIILDYYCELWISVGLNPFLYFQGKIKHKRAKKTGGKKYENSLILSEHLGQTKIF